MCIRMRICVFWIRRCTVQNEFKSVFKFVQKKIKDKINHYAVNIANNYNTILIV